MYAVEMQSETRFNHRRNQLTRTVVSTYKSGRRA